MGKLHSGWEAPKLKTFLAFNVSAVTKGNQLIAFGEVGNTMLAIGVDIGRTKIAIAVVDGRGGIVAREQITAPSAEDPASVSDAVGKLISETLIRYPDIVAVGVGTPEIVEWPDGVVRAGLAADKQYPLRAVLEETTGLPTVVDSDANVASWAEARLGAAIGKRDIVMLTVGTGVGGGFVLDGKMYRGSRGMAGEVGHLLVTPFGPRCACGNVGCLESLASGTALGREGRRTAAMNPSGLMATLAGAPELVTGEIVTDAALQGDPEAIALFDQLGFWLGRGIASLILLFDPDVVVVGGGLVRTGPLLLDPTRLSAERGIVLESHKLPPIVPAKFGSDAGVVGAAILALDTKTSALTGPTLGN